MIVFISHSSRNVVEARGIRHWLKSQGIDHVFLSPSPIDGIGGASDWRKSIRRAIRKSDVVLPLVSADWLKSEHCADELDLALMLSKRIIPVRLDKTPVERLPDHIQRRQICDVSDMACEDEGYAKLLRALPQRSANWASSALAGLAICASLGVYGYSEWRRQDPVDSCSDKTTARSCAGTTCAKN